MNYLEMKKELHLKQVNEIELLQRRLNHLRESRTPFSIVRIDRLESLVTKPAFVETEEGILPVVVYHGGSALSLCPHCDKLHDVRAVESGAVMTYAFLQAGKYVALQYNALYEDSHGLTFTPESIGRSYTTQ